ncbi:MAG TPA: winged helix-turn-helix domain-containing protein [Stellaceae bacterium]|nr:winged helix-turn-helix domain-containing protein [Stellaceae bacterium]
MRLRPKCFEVLTYFVKNPGRLLPKDELMEAAWPGVFVTEDSLVQCVKEIRRAIGDNAQDLIKTIPGRGYIFDLQVVSVERASEPPARTHRWTKRLQAVDWRLLAALILLFSLGCGAVGWWLRAPAEAPTSAETPPPPAPAPAAPRLSIAVLLFVNLGGDPADDFIADGVTDDLTTGLSTHVSEVQVAARGSAAARKGRYADGAQAGRSLGVRYALEGSIRRDGNRIAVSVQLLDTQSGAHFWSDRFEGERSELFALEDRITGRVAYALGNELVQPAARDAAFRGSAPDADDLGLRGPAVLAQPRALENLNQAEALFRDALAMDDRDVGALEGLATALIARLVNFSPQRQADRDDLLQQADDAAEKALALAPERSTAHYIKGVLLQTQRKTVEASQEFQLAILLDPNYGPAYDGLGASMLHLGQPEKAVPLIEQSLRLGWSGDVNVLSKWHMAMAHLFLRHDEFALEWLRQARSESPDDGWWLLRELTAVCALKGDEEAAKSYLAELLRAWPQVSIAALKARRESDDPEYLRLMEETVFAGLRKAGLPEL